MATKPIVKPRSFPDAEQLLKTRYGFGPVQFAGTARSVRDILSQRWLLSDKTYEQRNSKRLYYLSLEFLIGRSLTSNVMRPHYRRIRSRHMEGTTMPNTGMLVTRDMTTI
jgi:hypothetical protein